MGPKKKDAGGDDQRVIDFGHPERNPPFADNSVKTSKYTWFSFFPLVSESWQPMAALGSGDRRRSSEIYFQFCTRLAGWSCEHAILGAADRFDDHGLVVGNASGIVGLPSFRGTSNFVLNPPALPLEDDTVYQSNKPERFWTC